MIQGVPPCSLDFAEEFSSLIFNIHEPCTVAARVSKAAHNTSPDQGTNGSVLGVMVLSNKFQYNITILVIAYMIR